MITLLENSLILSHKLLPSGRLVTAQQLQTLVQTSPSIVARFLDQQMVFQKLLGNWGRQIGLVLFWGEFHKGSLDARDSFEFGEDAGDGVVVCGLEDLVAC